MALLEGIGDLLFGKEEKPSIQKTSTLSKYQKPISKQLSQYLEGKIGTPVAGYTGETVAPLSTREQTAFTNIEDMLGTLSITNRENISKAIQKALSGTPSYDLSQDVVEDYFRTNIANPLRDEYQRALPFALEEVKGRLGGTPTTSLERVTGDITENYLDALSQARAKTMLEAEFKRAGLSESAADRALTAISPASEFGRYERERPIEEQKMLAQIGQVERALEQAQLDWDYKEFLRVQPENAPYINQALSYLQIPTQAVMGTQGYNQPGMFQDLIGQMIAGSDLTLPGFGEGGMFTS